jgi:uncharacterized protein YidB (DUF937 family)
MNTSPLGGIIAPPRRRPYHDQTEITMGMLESLLGSVMGGMAGGSSAQGQNPLIQIALQLLQQNGGIGGVVDKFHQAGYGAQADSWVSTGQNQPINGDALQQVLGSGTLRDVASQLGVAPNAAAGDLASMLPQLIDGMTPQGHLPDAQDDPVAQVLAMLQAKRGR